MKNKTIMNSHEEYCRQLKIVVKRYTDYDILKLAKETKSNIRLADYNAIYEQEKKLRNL